TAVADLVTVELEAALAMRLAPMPGRCGACCAGSRSCWTSSSWPRGAALWPRGQPGRRQARRGGGQVTGASDHVDQLAESAAAAPVADPALNRYALGQVRPRPAAGPRGRDRAARRRADRAQLRTRGRDPRVDRGERHAGTLRQPRRGVATERSSDGEIRWR